MKSKFYYVLYSIASMPFTVGIFGALMVFAAESLHWLWFGDWPRDWSLLTEPLPQTGFIGFDRIITALSHGPLSVQLLVVGLISFPAVWWFKRLYENADQKGRLGP